MRPTSFNAISIPGTKPADRVTARVLSNPRTTRLGAAVTSDGASASLAPLRFVVRARHLDSGAPSSPKRPGLSQPCSPQRVLDRLFRFSPGSHACLPLARCLPPCEQPYALDDGCCLRE